jgi:hypothetical protein
MLLKVHINCRSVVAWTARSRLLPTFLIIAVVPRLLLIIVVVMMKAILPHFQPLFRTSHFLPACNVREREQMQNGGGVSAVSAIARNTYSTTFTH